MISRFFGTKLLSFQIPNSVTYIGKQAFVGTENQVIEVTDDSQLAVLFVPKKVTPFDLFNVFIQFYAFVYISINTKLNKKVLQMQLQYLI